MRTNNPAKFRFFTWLNAIMFILFLLCVVVQYNDPDAPIWMMMYGLAALCCLLFLWNRLHWGISALLAGVALVWAIFLAPHVIGRVSIYDLFSSIQMKDLSVEQAREMGGLLIITVWMVVLSFSAHRHLSHR